MRTTPRIAEERVRVLIGVREKLVGGRSGLRAADGSIERSRVAGNVSQLNTNGTCIPKDTLAMGPPKIMQDSSHFISIFPTTRWIVEPVIGAFGP